MTFSLFKTSLLSIKHRPFFWLCILGTLIGPKIASFSSKFQPLKVTSTYQKSPTSLSGQLSTGGSYLPTCLSSHFFFIFKILVERKKICPTLGRGRFPRQGLLNFRPLLPRGYQPQDQTSNPKGPISRTFSYIFCVFFSLS